MSDVKTEEIKPVEATKTAEPEASTASAAAETTTETAAVETPEAAEDKKDDEEKPEPKEITHGTLSKAHGGLLSFFKYKRFFYFQDEAVSEADLQTYLHKGNTSKTTAAYALQTGKGLWFYSKDEAHKAPHGIIKLSDVTEVTESGTNKFVLKLSTSDLHFEAPVAERDSWVFTLKGKINEAKDIVEEVTASEGYAAALEKLTPKPVAPKPATKEDTPAEAAAPAEAGTAPTDEAKPAETPAETPAEEAAAPAEAKPEVKRTPSKKNKRLSTLPFFGKKEKAEEKKEEEPKAEDKEETAEASTAAAAGSSAAVEPAAETKPAEEPVAEEKKEEEPKADVPKKGSNLHSFFQRGKKDKAPAEEKKDKEPEVVTVKDTSAVVEPETADKPAETPAEEKKDEKKTPSSPKSSPLSFFGRRDKSPAPKAVAPVEEKKDEPEAATEPATEAPKETAAPAEENPAESPKETASSPKEKRKSFFGFPKEKKPEEVKSDSEDAEPAPKPSTSPGAGFLTTLKRKVSKAGKTDKEPKEVVTPAPVIEEDASKETAEAAAPAETPAETTAEAAPAIGDVVPDAVTVGSPVQATA